MWADCGGQWVCWALYLLVWVTPFHDIRCILVALCLTATRFCIKPGQPGSASSQGTNRKLVAPVHAHSVELVLSLCQLHLGLQNLALAQALTGM
jgi:hypothetical protein